MDARLEARRRPRALWRAARGGVTRRRTSPQPGRRSVANVPLLSGRRSGDRMLLAVVGCGAVVEGLYAGALRRLEARGIATVGALVDPDAARAASLRRHFRSARVFTSAPEALESLWPDVAIVASPPRYHAEHAVVAVAAGSHVLCEKPMATNGADGRRMVESARRRGRVLAAGMARRFLPAIADARALVDEGALGTDLRFVYREGQVYSWPVSTDAPFRRASGGGGVLADFGSHAIDLLSALFGVPRVVSYADDATADGVETNCVARLEFPAARGTVQLSWSQPLATGLRVAGSAGELCMHPAVPGTLRFRRHGGPWRALPPRTLWPADLRADGANATARTYYDCIFLQLVQVLRAVARGGPVPVDGTAALATIDAIEACYARAEPLRLPWLPDGERARAAARHWSARPWAA